MNETILHIQDLLANYGVPSWLQQPAAWLAIACSLVGLLLVVRMLLRRRPAGSDPPAAVATRGASSPPSSGGVFGTWTEALAGQIPESDKERVEFGQMLKQAGMYSRTARASVYAYRFLLMVFPLICAGLLAIFSPPDQTWKILIGGGIIAAVLSIIPRLYIWYCRKTRLAIIGAGLADMLDMLSMCLSGGMSISASLDHVSKNLSSYPALADELQILKRQTDVGSLRIALVDFANRLDTPECRQVATLLARGDALGSSMSGSLLDQADHFRTARKQLATLQANRMPVFLTFPLLFCFAPAVLIILMSPSFLELTEFFDPANADNPLRNNESLSPQLIVESLESLDQDISAARPAGARPSLAPRVN